MSQPIDTRALFRPLAGDLASLLRGLSTADFERPTVAPHWRVRDVVAHIVDLTHRRLSYHRDAMPPPPPSRPINSERDFVAFINDLNAVWIAAARRFSPRVMTEMAEHGTRALADWFESLSLDAPALFGVSWAGEMQSDGWFDVGREFAELWHHQQQIRMAVGAPVLTDARYLRPVLGIAMRAVPHALRDVGTTGDTLAVEITGDAGGAWTLTRASAGWTMTEGGPGLQTGATTHVRTSDDTAWRLLFHMLPEADARGRMEIAGRANLVEPLLRARAVIV
jgi:uncharacterized protein (TIGR03083 family)